MKKTTSVSLSTAEDVRNQIESGGERIWRLDDFENMPFTAVAQALSRLSKKELSAGLARDYTIVLDKHHLAKASPLQVSFML